jgi:hypothetical protein
MNAMNQDDQLLRDLFKKNEVRSTPDLTQKVMHQIDQNSKIFEYEPVISKEAWIMIGSVFSLTLIYLLSKTGGASFQVPEVLQLISESFTGLGSSLSFKTIVPKLPEIPSTILISIAALNIIGIYLIVSYKWLKGMFRP